MLPDRVSNPGPLTYESGALPIALRSPAKKLVYFPSFILFFSSVLELTIMYIMKPSNLHKIQFVAPSLWLVLGFKFPFLHFCYCFIST